MPPQAMLHLSCTGQRTSVCVNETNIYIHIYIYMYVYVYAHVCTLLCLDLQRFLFFANGHTLCRQQRQQLSFGLSNNSIAGTQCDSTHKKNILSETMLTLICIVYF